MNSNSISVCAIQDATDRFACDYRDIGDGRHYISLRLGTVSIIFRGYNEDAVEAAREACVALQIATSQVERVCRQRREQEQEIADAAGAR